jgi:hypothetical protein
MFSETTSMQKYLSFVFPEKITPLRKPTPLKFYTFEIKEITGTESFFHCLVFDEELDGYQIENSVDYEGPLINLRIKKLQRLNRF